jgi:RNA polymerase sigma-70 factor, ECF subfamily
MGVASFSFWRLSLPHSAYATARRLDRAEGRWYPSALVNGDSDRGVPAPESDEALVRAIANGDTGALAALYDRHAPLMLGLARRIVLAKPEAEDIVHDVFVEAWRRAADYDESRGSVRAWLLLRTRSRAIDFRKSAAVARTVPTGDGDWLAALADPRADDSEAPDRARLRQRLSGLSAEQREVLWLGYFEGLSSSEMATRVGVPIGTIKSRVAAALAALRLALTDAEGHRR